MIITHHSIQKRRTAVKESSMRGLFNCWYRPYLQVCFHTSQLSSVRTNVIVHATSNVRGLQLVTLLTNGTRSMHNSIHSIQMHSAHSHYDIYDAKPQSVKTPVVANQEQYHQITHANVH